MPITSRIGHGALRVWRAEAEKFCMVDRSTDTYSFIAIEYAYLSGKYQDDEEIEDEGSLPLLCGRD
eukprot:7990770-Karenia_brevis.AAC.1